MLLSDAQLTTMRATAQLALPDTATIHRRTEVSDGGGGTTTTWALLAQTPCRIAPLGGGESATAGARIADESTHVVTLPAQTDITESDRIVIGDATLEITLVRERGAWELTRRAECKEMP